MVLGEAGTPLLNSVSRDRTVSRGRRLTDYLTKDYLSPLSPADPAVVLWSCRGLWLPSTLSSYWLPTGRYDNFVDCCLPCLNEKLGAKFCAIPARGIPIATI